MRSIHRKPLLWCWTDDAYSSLLSLCLSTTCGLHLLAPVLFRLRGSFTAFSVPSRLLAVRGRQCPASPPSVAECRSFVTLPGPHLSLPVYASVRARVRLCSGGRGAVFIPTWWCVGSWRLGLRVYVVCVSAVFTASDLVYPLCCSNFVYCVCVCVCLCVSSFLHPSIHPFIHPSTRRTPCVSAGGFRMPNEHTNDIYVHPRACLTGKHARAHIRSIVSFDLKFFFWEILCADDDLVQCFF